MLQRVFIGWDEPFLKPAASWLLEHREQMPGMLLILPTAQSGRRMREALAETAGAVLSPRISTPGALMNTGHIPDIAPAWLEQLAWVEVLEEVQDWTPYQELFSGPPGDDHEWAVAMAAEMTTLRYALQENGLLLKTAARRLKESVEQGRWEALATLEHKVEQRLFAWGCKSRSRILEKGIVLPAGISQIVLAGTFELPPLVARALIQWEGNVTILVGAPSTEEESFDEWGRPKVEWSLRPLLWPEVRVTADPRQQASEALRIVAGTCLPSDQWAIGSADSETGDELARAFTRHGWPAFHPATIAYPGGLINWLRIWSKWLQDPTMTVFQDLLSLPETEKLIFPRAQRAKQLAELRDRWMVVRSHDLQRLLDEKKITREHEILAAREILEAAHTLENRREQCLEPDFTHHLHHLLAAISPAAEREEMQGWLTAVEPMTTKLTRPASFWIDLMISSLSRAMPLPPEGRVIDIQGWLEIFHEPGKHLILCGMNEGKVPAHSGGEPWLSESSRGVLGLTKDEDRAARDAYLYHAMLKARLNDGSVHALCAKTGAGGESLLPSRLLLAAENQELPSRVKLLFQEIEPPEAGLRMEADWLWQPRKELPPARISVTSLADYLACPFRFYLKHVIRMRQTEPHRNEWNPRDFGTVAHEILERWACDTEAQNYENPAKLHAWLSHELDGIIGNWFGSRPPLAVRIQAESLRQRLAWFAQVQTSEKMAGWDVVEVERKVEIPIGQSVIVAKIDRIDLNRETGEYRVLDYKTGKVDTVDRAHRLRLTAKTPLYEHLPQNSPAFYDTEEKGKTTRFRWLNLQLPLYASAWLDEKKQLPKPCYFTLGTTEGDIGIRYWENFSFDDLAAARECAGWLVEKIAAGAFWPPSERVTYDDYKLLAAGRTLMEQTLAPEFQPSAQNPPT